MIISILAGLLTRAGITFVISYSTGWKDPYLTGKFGFFIATTAILYLCFQKQQLEMIPIYIGFFLIELLGIFESKRKGKKT